MRDDVVRQATEDVAAAMRMAEVAEQESFVRRGIKGIGVGEGVRRHFHLMARKTPGYAPTEREFEPRQRAHDNGVQLRA